jgi:hypothetical protein
MCRHNEKIKIYIIAQETNYKPRRGYSMHWRQKGSPETVGSSVIVTGKGECMGIHLY